MCVPKLLCVPKDDSWVWKVEYAGMTRTFEMSQEWDAYKFFEYVTECYAALSKSKESR